MKKINIKKINFNVYNSKSKELIQKYNNIGVRKFDIDNAFELYGNIGPNLKILELGCFTGREFGYIKNFTKNYTGIDISEEAIKYAKNNYSDGDFIVGDFEDYEFKTNFGIIFAFASLVHSDYETTVKLFGKFYKILNKGGIVYISMKSSKEYSKKIKKDEFGTRIFYYYSLNEYKKIAGNLFETIYENEHFFNNENWFTVCFRKI